MRRNPIEIALPSLLHVGLVVSDLEAAIADFDRRWGARVTEIREVTWHDALFYARPVSMTFRSGVIRSGASQVELTQPLSGSPFADFLNERRGDGVHHLAYAVDEIDVYLDRLNPTSAELVLDARVSGSRVVQVDGFAHGPSIELIQLASSDTDETSLY